MTRFAVTNDDETVTIHVWAFDEKEALYQVECLTNCNLFTKVKNANTISNSNLDRLASTFKH